MKTIYIRNRRTRLACARHGTNYAKPWITGAGLVSDSKIFNDEWFRESLATFTERIRSLSKSISTISQSKLRNEIDAYIHTLPNRLEGGSIFIQRGKLRQSSDSARIIHEPDGVYAELRCKELQKLIDKQPINISTRGSE